MEGRRRRTSSGGTGVHRRGSGLGTGPVGSVGGGGARKGSSSGGGPSSGGSGGPRRSGGGGGFNPITLIIVLAVVLLGGGGGLGSLLGGGSGSQSSSGTSSYSSGSGSSGYSNYSSGSGTSGYGGYSGGSGTSGFGGYSGFGSGGLGSFGSGGSGSSSSSGSGSFLNDTLSGLDLSGLLGSLSSGGTTNQTLTGTYTGWGDDNNTGDLNTSVAPEASGKFTKLKGNGKDTVTIMVYMCGTDLESRSSMATSDIVEMTKATLSDKVNVILYTGGCTKWNNNIISSRTNQIYQVKDGGLKCLVSDDGDRVMTDPATLTRFIKWCGKNYPANRNELIFWDHGGGSVSGYGYDERYSQGQTMTLAGIRHDMEQTAGSISRTLYQKGAQGFRSYL